jgi:hypothetical protein
MRRIYLLLSAIAILGAGCQKPAAAPTAPNPVTWPVQATSSTMGQGTFAFQEGSLQETTKEYTIKLTYPVMVTGTDPGISQTFNQEVQTPLQELVKSFKQDRHEVQAEAGDTPEGQWLLEMDGHVEFQNESLVSVYLWGSMYSGGAHPNAAYQATLFDVKTRSAVGVTDLMQNASTGLKKIAELSRLKLKAEGITDLSDAEWIASGTEPKEENYQVVYFTPKGMTVVFPPYQVAAYAAGPVRIEFRPDELKGILQDQYIP